MAHLNSALPTVTSSLSQGEGMILCAASVVITVAAHDTLAPYALIIRDACHLHPAQSVWTPAGDASGLLSPLLAPGRSVVVVAVAYTRNPTVERGASF